MPRPPWKLICRAAERLAAKSAERAAEGLDDRAVHRLRVATKRLRAAWRLVGGDAADAAKAGLRAINHCLADTRDHAVLRRAAGARGVVVDAPPQLEPPPGEEIAAGFRLEAGRWRQQASEAGDRKLPVRRLTKTYKKARRRFEAADIQDADAETFHAWRKKTKDLLYQLDWMHLALDEDRRAVYRRALRDLARIQGEVNDLDNLRRRMREADPDDHRRLALDEDRLREDALARGEELFARKPKRWLKKLR